MTNETSRRVNGTNALCTQKFCRVWWDVANVIISETKLQNSALQSMITRTPDSENSGLCYEYRFQALTRGFSKTEFDRGGHQISPDGLFNKIPRWFWWTLKFENCCRRDSTPCFCTLCHKDSERDREFVSNTMRDKPDESWWYELWISSCQRNPFRQERPALAFNGVERNREPKEFLLQTAVSRGCSQVTSCSDAQTHTAANVVQMDSHPLLIAHGRSSGCSQGNFTSSLMGPLLMDEDTCVMRTLNTQNT